MYRGLCGRRTSVREYPRSGENFTLKCRSVARHWPRVGDNDSSGLVLLALSCRVSRRALVAHEAPKKSDTTATLEPKSRRVVQTRLWLRVCALDSPRRLNQPSAASATGAAGTKRCLVPGISDSVEAVNVYTLLPAKPFSRPFLALRRRAFSRVSFFDLFPRHRPTSVHRCKASSSFFRRHGAQVHGGVYLSTETV